MMLDGKQWLQFMGDRGVGGLWQKMNVSKQNEYIPRPVTNYLFSVYQTLKGYLIKNKPRSTVHPNTQENRDKAAAKIATLILEYNWTRLKEQYNYEAAASTMVTYGTVFKKSYWDTSSVSMVKVPKMELKPIMDPMTGAPVGMQEVPAIDPQTGQELFVELPLGDVNTYVIDPFRMSLDPLATHLHEARWVMESSIQPLDWIIETYQKEAPGYTGQAAEVKEDTHLNGSMRRWFQLKTTSGTRNGTATGSGGGNASDIMIENCAVVNEYYERPNSKNPHGRLIVIAGDKCIYSGPSPYTGPEMGDWHPYSECRWEIVPGRFWGKSPLDDATEIQKQINTIDSTVILTRKTMAMPQRLIPIGSGIAAGEWTGRPAQNVFYRDQGPGSATPSVIRGEGVHATVFAERDQKISDMKEITGAIDILRGDRPPGVNAASALNMLYEVGTGKLFPILDRWKQFVEDDQKKQLKLIADRYKEPRPEFIRKIKSLNTDLSEVEINNFIGEDLHDNCNVVVEAGSNVPKLQSAHQALLIELAQLGTLNLQDPANRLKFNEELGVTGYDQDVAPDTKRAQWENDLMDDLFNNPLNKPVVFAGDNHQIHILEHQNRTKSPSFMSLALPIQQAYFQHIQQHEQFEAMAQHAAMMQSQAMQGPGGAQPGPQAAPPAAGGRKPPGGHGGSHQGAGGIGQNIKDAVLGSDILTPASLGGGRR